MTDREAFEAWLAPKRGQICPPHPEDYLQVWQAALAYERAKQAEPKFAHVYCSQCGGEFGPGNHGYSHCEDHAAPPAVPAPSFKLAGKVDFHMSAEFDLPIGTDLYYAAPPADDEAVRLLVRTTETNCAGPEWAKLCDDIEAYVARVGK